MVDLLKRSHIVLFFLLFISINIHSQGYRIQIDAPQFAGNDVILAEYIANNMVPKDTAHLDLDGAGFFEGESAFDGGMYIVYFNSRYYFDILLDKDQDFSVKTDTADFIHNTVFSGSADNEQFYSYKQYLSTQREDNQKILAKLEDAKNEKDSLKVRKELEKLNEKTTEEIEKLISDNSELFFATFLQSMKEAKAPEEIVKGTDRQKDSIRYNYFKDHYFDYFDITDIRLFHTPIYESKIKTYLNKAVPPHPDSLIIAVDMLMEKSRTSDALFRYMLITVFNHFAESKLMGMDKVYFHIAEKYYIPEATWSSEEFINKLKTNLEKSRHTFVNNPASDFVLKGLPKEHFLMAEMDTAIKEDPHIGDSFHLYDIDAAYTIIYFWEADCGHCQKSTPKLYEVFKKYEENGLKVLSVHVINSVEGKVKWVDFVNEHEMYDWINCWSPYSNDFRKMYNLESFPQLFLLDKDKKIMAKNISPEQVDGILDGLLNKE